MKFSKCKAIIFPLKINFKNHNETSMVLQWLGICLPMQGTQVQFLVWEDSTHPQALGKHHSKTLRFCKFSFFQITHISDYYAVFVLLCMIISLSKMPSGDYTQTRSRIFFVHPSVDGFVSWLLQILVYRHSSAVSLQYPVSIFFG